MKKNNAVTALLLVVNCFTFKSGKAQSPHYKTLYQYGISSFFSGGLFRDGIPVAQIRLNGDFGIAAPSLVDGELIEYKGKFYQTKSDGTTQIAPDTLPVPFGMVCFFK